MFRTTIPASGGNKFSARSHRYTSGELNLCSMIAPCRSTIIRLAKICKRIANLRETNGIYKEAGQLRSAVPTRSGFATRNYQDPRKIRFHCIRALRTPIFKPFLNGTKNSSNTSMLQIKCFGMDDFKTTWPVLVKTDHSTFRINGRHKGKPVTGCGTTLLFRSFGIIAFPLGCGGVAQVVEDLARCQAHDGHEGRISDF